MSGQGINQRDIDRAHSNGNSIQDIKAAGTADGGWASQMPEAYKAQLETEARYKALAAQHAFKAVPLALGGGGSSRTFLQECGLVIKAVGIFVLLVAALLGCVIGFGWVTAPSTANVDLGAVKHAMPDIGNYQTDNPRVQTMARKPIATIVKAHIPDGFYHEVSDEHAAARQAIWLSYLANPSSIETLDSSLKGKAINEAREALPDTPRTRLDLGRAMTNGFFFYPVPEKEARRMWRRSAIQHPRDATLEALALDGATTTEKLLHWRDRGWAMIRLKLDDLVVAVFSLFQA